MLYRRLPVVKKGANVTATILADMIAKGGLKNKKRLLLQWDGASENVAYTNIRFCVWLLSLGSCLFDYYCMYYILLLIDRSQRINEVARFSPLIYVDFWSDILISTLIRCVQTHISTYIPFHIHTHPYHVNRDILYPRANCLDVCVGAAVNSCIPYHNSRMH